MCAILKFRVPPTSTLCFIFLKENEHDSGCGVNAISLCSSVVTQHAQQYYFSQTAPSRQHSTLGTTTVQYWIKGTLNRREREKNCSALSSVFSLLAKFFLSGTRVLQLLTFFPFL